MLDPDFAEKFIERVTRYTDYNVNIMDDRGVIIASRDKSRIGQYHEIAYRLVTGGEESIDTTGMAFPNVYQGINMVIQTGGRREGVVGVTGDPDEVRPVALMIKMAFETMLKYERQQEQQRRRASRKEQFLYLLTQVEHSDPEELRSCARELGYPEEPVRLPILLRLDGMDAEQTLQVLRESPLHTRRDFSFLPDEEHVLVCKTVGEADGALFSRYREELREYLDPVLNQARRQGSRPGLYVGSFQDSYPQYYYGFRHCRWMERNLERRGEPLFFYDHMGEYLRSVLPQGELQRALYVFRDRLAPEKQRQLLETVGALIRTNYNFGKAAELLFVHKNTLVYRYNQLKALLGADPMASAEDRAFLETLYSYLLCSEEPREHGSG